MFFVLNGAWQTLVCYYHTNITVMDQQAVGQRPTKIKPTKIEFSMCDIVMKENTGENTKSKNESCQKFFV